MAKPAAGTSEQAGYSAIMMIPPDLRECDFFQDYVLASQQKETNR